MLVTDHQYYMDDNLKNLVDLCIKRQKKKWDNLLVIDGDERSGKTQLAKTIAYYYTHATGKKLSLNNLFFDPEKMMEYATDNEEDVLIWDEAAFGGLSIQWQRKIQQKLNSMLMATGKYRDFYLFIIPSFFRLNRYLALDRSLGLLHVYSPDMLKRGLFTCLSKKQKTWVYNNNRKSETYGKDFSFRGRFTIKNTEKIWDEEEYEAKKDDAIKKYLKGGEDSGKGELTELQNSIASKLPTEQAMNVGNVCKKTIYNWKARVLGF